jgi:hypothetical protein
MRHPALARGVVAGIDDEGCTLYGVAAPDVQAFSLDADNLTVTVGPVLTRRPTAGRIDDRGRAGRRAAFDIKAEPANAASLLSSSPRSDFEPSTPAL